MVVQAQLTRCSGEVRLVVAPDAAKDATSRTVPSLLKAIARAHEWYGLLLNGEVNGRRSISKIIGLDERYVARILECAFLAKVGSLMDDYMDMKRLHIVWNLSISFSSANRFWRGLPPRLRTLVQGLFSSAILVCFVTFRTRRRARCCSDRRNGSVGHRENQKLPLRSCNQRS